MSKELGLFDADGNFTSDKDIKRRNMTHDEVEFVTPVSPENRSLEEWANILERRQNERLSIRNTPEHVEITIKAEKPIGISLIGDGHVGAEHVDIQRLRKDVENTANTPGAYAILVGDMTDSFFWGGEAQDEQVAAFTEQNAFYRACLDALAANKSLLAGFRGDHDGWAMKMGEDMNVAFAREFGAYALDGVSYITLTVGEQIYRLTGCHRAPGNSIFNNTHPANRLYKSGGGEGSDIIFNGHIHRKGYSVQPVKRFGGETAQIHMITIGPYKYTDRYAKKKGFAQQGEDHLGGLFVMLWPDSKRIQVFYDIQEGLGALENERAT